MRNATFDEVMALSKNIRDNDPVWGRVLRISSRFVIAIGKTRSGYYAHLERIN